MAYCTHCGTKLPEGVNYCPFCAVGAMNRTSGTASMRGKYTNTVKTGKKPKTQKRPVLRWILIALAAFLLIGCIANRRDSTAGSSGTGSDSNSGTASVRSSSSAGAELSPSAYASALPGRWIDEYGGYIEFFSDGWCSSDDKGFTFRYSVENGRLSIDASGDFGGNSSITMTENTLTLVNEDHETSVLYRLEGTAYPTPGALDEATVTRYYEADCGDRFDISTESQVLETGSEGNGVSYATVQTTLRYNYTYLTVCQNNYTTWLWSGAVGRWFYLSTDYLDAKYMECNLAGTSWVGSEGSITFESFEIGEGYKGHAGYITCTWTYQDKSGSGTYVLSLDTQSDYSDSSSFSSSRPQFYAHASMWLEGSNRSDAMLYLYGGDGIWFGDDMSHGEFLTQVR